MPQVARSTLLWEEGKRPLSVENSVCRQDREILMWAFNTGAQVFRVLDGNSRNNHPQATQRLNNEDSAYFLSFGTLTDKCVGKLR